MAMEWPVYQRQKDKAGKNKRNSCKARQKGYKTQENGEGQQ